jgi:hypothetical protein
MQKAAKGNWIEVAPTMTQMRHQGCPGASPKMAGTFCLSFSISDRKMRSANALGGTIFASVSVDHVMRPSL